MTWSNAVDEFSVVAPYVGAVGGAVVGFFGGAGVGAVAGAAAGFTAGEALHQKRMNKPRPNTGLPPTEADAQKHEADKSNLRRQRAAAILSQGTRANILTSPLGIPGDSAGATPVQGRKTLLGS